MFLPTTPEEVKRCGWDALDIILVSDDSYIDGSYIGVAVIGKVLAQAGFRVGIIAQPHCTNDAEIGRLGEPRLFWGVTAGCVDSMVANYTAPRNQHWNLPMRDGTNPQPVRGVCYIAKAKRTGYQELPSYEAVVADMAELKRFTSQKLQMNPEQVQIFTPPPSTYSTLMYYTGMDSFTHEPIQVEKNLYRKECQKEIVTCKPSQRNFHSH